MCLSTRRLLALLLQVADPGLRQAEVREGDVLRQAQVLRSVALGRSLLSL